MRSRSIFISGRVKVFLLVLFLGILSLFVSGCNKTSGYQASICSYDDFSKETQKWMDSCKSSGYFEYINSDPDSWEMLLYYPGINSSHEPFIYGDIRLSLEASVLKVFITRKAASNNDRVDDDLIIHITAPSRGAWPNGSEMYIDGVAITCLGKEYKD
jgi:hypothetical protein